MGNLGEKQFHYACRLLWGQANDSLVADGITFCHVHPTDCIVPLACTYGIPAISVCLGASYFQRLASKNTGICLQANRLGWFEKLVRFDMYSMRQP